MVRRVIAHVDMNAFFASVEQKANPALRGRPVAVVGAGKRTVVTTASYEARAYGVRTGMTVYEAKAACPCLTVVAGDNGKYMDASGRVFEVLKGFSPAIEAYSIDEAFIDATGSMAAFASPRAFGLAVKEGVWRATGLRCSVGVAPNKLLAKLASDMRKPDGLVVMEEEVVPSILDGLPADALCGVGPRLSSRLRALGIRTCAELGRAPASLLRQRFGIIGERLKLMGMGIDQSPVVPIGEEAEAKSIGHSTTLPMDTSDRGEIRAVMLRLSEMVGGRARRHGLKGSTVSLTLRYPDFQTFTRGGRLHAPTNDTRSIYLGAIGILGSLRLRDAVRLIGVTLSGTAKDQGQTPLFEGERSRERLLAAMDAVNERFGNDTLTWAALLSGDGRKGPGVIAPSWRPVGVRRVDAG
jgi:DNA polymerase-4